MNKENAPSFRFLPTFLIRAVLSFFERIAVFFVRLGVSPNTLSVIGLLAGAAAGLLFFSGEPGWGGLAVVVCGLLDVLDGKVAVRANKKSRYGAIFDSSLDRYSEFLILMGLAWHFRASWVLWVVFFGFLGSTMVSYTRARAEGLGFDCKVGIMQRAERIILMATAALLGAAFRVFDPAMTVALCLIAFFSHITAAQRIAYVRRADKLANVPAGTKEV
ncbi:MAG: CDP-alcohol phosphatidyltransferase family protein [Candidatus Aminicenantes bacterium]|nr:CDP-alcohol phosphatidyltransferase family protein [Candidatus Aminicenantes bacterium]